ncbi:MAG TPA: GxxExxY protein, partial [Chlamydiales bacterium]|nr:GxxExxY protein [Chlamydiales bacterium]
MNKILATKQEGSDAVESCSSKAPDFQITGMILKCCFEIMDELGCGFLESVYRNALFFSLQEKGLTAEVEKIFEVYFKKQKIG